MAFVEAELELSRTSIAKVMSERRDLDVENKMLRNELEDIKAKCDTLEGNKEIMMSEILDLEKIKLRSKVELKTMKEDMEEMRKKFEETETTQKSMSDEWKVKEEEMQKQLEEMKSRLIHAAEEYQKVYKQNVKLENRFDRIKTKIKVSSDLNFDNYLSFSSI
jgi:predicted nuclease with TOPRIM domain